ncbi:MAG: hypothetical protein ACJAZ0_001884 [Halioglobus sp.]|jgi:hypothetical protein
MKLQNAWLILSCVLFAAGSAQAKDDWIEKSDINSMRVLEAQAAFAPESIAGYGLAQFDGDIMDLRAKSHERSQASTKNILQQMQGHLKSEQQPQVREDLEILIQSLQDDIESSDINHNHLLPYFNMHATLFFSFNSLLDVRNDPSRYVKALDRLRKYNGREGGYTAITELAKARTEERLKVPGLVGPFRGEVETDIDNAERYIEGMRSIFERAGIDGWQADFEILEQQLADYLQWIRDVVLALSRADNQLPAAVYSDNLKAYGVRAVPEQLIADAQYSYQLIRGEMKALARRIAEQRGWQKHDLISVMRALKKEQIPQDKILEVYQQRLADVEDIIRRENLVTLPNRDAIIRLATEAESAAIPASFMSPPQLINNDGQYGEFVLVQSNPALGDEAIMDDWSHTSITWALTVHEARPGHELQFASLIENGTSLARAIFAFNSANAEGWGLYAEYMMHEFLPLEGQLFNLFTRLMRAARMFMDPMVNTGQMSPQQAIDFMMGQMALSLPMASSEADRYAFNAPGQATSYYYGFMSLMRLRTEVELTLADDFSAKEFHDFILRQGLLPPHLLRRAVLEQFVPQS